MVLFVFIYAERKTVALRHRWFPLVGTLVVGVSFGFPLYLYLRQRALDATQAKPSDEATSKMSASERLS